MGTTLKVKLSADSIRNAIKELQNYKDELKDKQQVFIEKLAEVGIDMAREKSKDTGGLHGTHRMGQYVTFEKRIEADGSNVKALVLGMGEEVYSKISDRSINALMALEFGTAALGLPPYKGSNSISGHSNDLVWYVWVNDDGVPIPYSDKTGHYKTLSAIAPTQPMYNAAMEMRKNILTVAHEVFTTDREVSC